MFLFFGSSLKVSSSYIVLSECFGFFSLHINYINLCYFAVAFITKKRDTDHCGSTPICYSSTFTTSVILHLLSFYMCHLSSDRALANMKWQIKPFIESKTKILWTLPVQKNARNFFELQLLFMKLLINSTLL